ncbi:MAG: VOC family protein [Synechococcaceae cyanobacterium]|nr:VOC family protein [Synechococcaceae cyanobacterium]
MERLCFHLSFPVADLDATERWYVDGLGCRRGRRSAQALILDLDGHQLVAQLTPPEGIGEPQHGIYPRHFGLVFEQRDDWHHWLERARSAGLHFGVEPRCRFSGQPLEYDTFFLIDPSGNWLEFKCYRQPEAALGMHEQTVVGDREFR